VATTSPIAKVSVGRTGCGAAHASYITRLTALDPEGRDRTRTEAEEPLDLSTLTHDGAHTAELSAAHTLNESFDHRSLGTREEHGGGSRRDADPVWTWNAPDFLTGDPDGSHRETGEPNSAEKLTLKEKAENLRLYFGSLEDYERRKGGRTHYRIILSFDVPATNHQIRDLTNNLLEETFPKAIAFGAIHRDTDHPHVHLYLNSRQTDGRRIQLKNNEFKTIDEKWARIYTEFAGDKSAHVEYLRKKEETRQWKIAASEAYRKGEKIPPKPERDNDKRERLAEQRLSAQRSEARDRGKQLDPRPPAEPLSRPASEKETSRLRAKTEVAREHLAHLIRTDAPKSEVKSVGRIAHELSAVLEKTVAAQKEMGREKPPEAVYTREELKQISDYRSSWTVAFKDDNAAGRLVAKCVLAGAEMKDARERADAYQVSRHLWKFDVEGWDRQLSLKDIEKAISAKAEEKLKLYNFLRPSKREQIQGQIEYLLDIKKDIQKQLAAKELGISRNVGAAEIKYQIAAQEVSRVQKTRGERLMGMPPPKHQRDELIAIDTIANRNCDARLLEYVYSNVRDKVLQNPTPQALSRVKGRAITSRLDMLKEAQRFNDAVKFGDFRQVPLKDDQGRDYTRSLWRLSPRNALEEMIRYFTDSPVQKSERRQMADGVRLQQECAEKRANQAADFSFVTDKILQEQCRAAGVSSDQVRPMLNRAEIAELRDFADRMYPASRIRQEFTDAARQAERGLQEREAAETARQAEQARAQDFASRSREQSHSQDRPRADRSDRDSYSRGR
jgi:MobA/VirD2-like, nuclease domain